jgi:hypothetical protein
MMRSFVIPEDAVDLGHLFPGFKRALAQIDGGYAVVYLICAELSETRAIGLMIKLRIDAMLNSLNQLRRAQSIQRAECSTSNSTDTQTSQPSMA